MLRKYKNKSLQRVYDASRAAGNDPTSEMYYRGFPHRGAAHRNAYWNGRAGLPTKLAKNSMAYPAWRAGRDDLIEYGPVMYANYPTTVSNPAALKPVDIKQAEAHFAILMADH